MNKTRSAEQVSPQRNASRSFFVYPIVIFVLGLLSIAMSFATDRLSARQMDNLSIADALMDIQKLAATSHLWLEESFDGDTDVDHEDIWANLKSAGKLCQALLEGGHTEHGLAFKPLKETPLRQRAERINTLFQEFNAIALHRGTVQEGATAADRDKEFDFKFKALFEEVAALETVVEGRHLLIRNQAMRLNNAILIFWILIIGCAMWRMWRFDAQRLAMAASLRRANLRLKTRTEDLQQHRRHLAELVEEATADLRSKNRQLQTEINQRKKMDAALSESQVRFKKLFTEFNTLASAISDSLVLYSPDLEVLWTNHIPGPCGSEERSTPRGQKCYSVSFDRSKSCQGCPAATSFVSGREEVRHSVTPDGCHWEVKAYPIMNESGAVTSVLTVAADVSDKMKLQAEALRVGHLASLGELAAGVAHEINNPVNGVINYAQLLIDEGNKVNADCDIQQRILKEGRRIAGIVKSLLSFAREDKQAHELVDIHDILSDTLDLSEAQLKKDGINLEIAMPEQLPPVMAHPQQIRQVFLNLVNNARYALNQKFSVGNKDKTLAIHGKTVTRDDTRYVKITFYDKGIGIPADIFHKILNPFFSTKPRGEGTGLGLSISHGIISAHGGELDIESFQGDHTSIDILLPVDTNHE